MITSLIDRSVTSTKTRRELVSLSSDTINTSHLANGSRNYIMDTDSDMIWDEEGQKWWGYVDPDAEVMGEEVTVSGIAPLTLSDALDASIVRLIQTGKTEQSGTPTPDAPVDIRCNNGVLAVRHQSGLPLRYRLLAWLRSTAVVDVGIKTTNDTEIEAAWTRITATAQYLYQSDSSSSGSSNTTAYITSSGNWRFGNRVVSVAPSLNTRYVSIQNSDGISLNGESVASYGSINTFTSSTNLRLLGSGNSLQVEYLKVRNSGVLVRDLVPVHDSVNDTYGFYDLVGGTFYTNADATFTAGSLADDPIEVVVVGTPEVLSVGGKNLFDEAQFITKARWTMDENGYYTGTYARYISAFRNGFAFDAPFKENTQYTFRCNGYVSASAIRFVFNYTDGTTSGIAVAANAPSDYTFTSATGKTISSITGTYGSGSDNVAWLKNIQIEEGSTATAYTPYRAPQTATAESLLAVGTYADTQDIISGAVTRRVGVKVLDGTEEWIKGTSSFYVDDIITDSPANNNFTVLCTHYIGRPGSDGASSLANTNSIRIYFSDYRRINIFATLSDYATSADFQSYLAAQYAQGTPVIVIYPLETELTEAVAAQDLSTIEGNNTVVVGAEVSDIALEIVYMKST